jgi:hypothetical protein
MVDIAAEKIIKEYPNGYTIRQDADLTNKEDGITYSDYQIVNPQGKVLVHDEDLGVLESFIANPVFLERLEKSGSIVKR